MNINIMTAQIDELRTQDELYLVIMPPPDAPRPLNPVTISIKRKTDKDDIGVRVAIHPGGLNADMLPENGYFEAAECWHEEADLAAQLGIAPDEKELLGEDPPANPDLPGPWQEDPRGEYSRATWRYDVFYGGTNLGYAEWVQHQREANAGDPPAGYKAPDTITLDDYPPITGEEAGRVVDETARYGDLRFERFEEE